MKRRRPGSSSSLFLLLAIALLPTLPGCGTTISNRDPAGERLPKVTGRSLEDRNVELPTDLGGSPAVLFVGYRQDAQFDIDRWALGLLQAESDLTRLEVPAVSGWFPELFLQPTIDDGMRAGIPKPDWPSVVTLYGSDADRMAAFTGTERARNARVILLDEDGVVRWFHDAGYSPGSLLDMLETSSGLD